MRNYLTVQEVIPAHLVKDKDGIEYIIEEKGGKRVFGPVFFDDTDEEDFDLAEEACFAASVVVDNYRLSVYARRGFARNVVHEIGEALQLEE